MSQNGLQDHGVGRWGLIYCRSQSYLFVLFSIVIVLLKYRKINILTVNYEKLIKYYMLFVIISINSAINHILILFEPIIKNLNLTHLQ